MNEIKTFKEFLINHNILDQYIKNVDAKRVKKFVNYGISFYYIIDASFLWKRTPEGEDYWRNIHKLWQHQYRITTNIDYSDIVEKLFNVDYKPNELWED